MIRRLLEEEEVQVEQDDDASEISDKPRIKDFKTTISYVKELQKLE